MKVTKNQMLEMLKKMLEIRYFEEKVVDQYARGAVPGLAHLYIGEEAVAVGTCSNLTDEDYITSTHRGHGHCIAKGGELKPMMAELFGKRTGYCKGKGGSMHIAAFDKGILGAMGIVGSGGPIAVGAALGIKKLNLDRVAICFFGDGASNEGATHEAMNFASLHKLPVIFVCENNGYGISVAQHRHQAIKDISVRAAGYDMPGVIVDGMDVLAVYEAVKDAGQEGQGGQRADPYRMQNVPVQGTHGGGSQPGHPLPSKDEMEKWKERCPIKLLKDKLVKEKIAKPQELEEIEENVKRRVEEAFVYAMESPFPKPEEALEDLFA